SEKQLEVPKCLDPRKRILSCDITDRSVEVANRVRGRLHPTLSGTMTSMRFLILFALPVFAFTQTAHITAEIGKTTVYGGLALSPDGKNLAWTQTLASQEQPRLWIGAVDGDFAPLPFSGPHTESDPSWSPDSKTQIGRASCRERV